MSTPCGEDIPSILELQLRKSVEMTKRDEDEGCDRCDGRFGSHQSHCPVLADEEIVRRLKALLADTRAMVVRAEALVASMRDPTNFRRY